MNEKVMIMTNTNQIGLEKRHDTGHRKAQWFAFYLSRFLLERARLSLER